MKSSEFSINGIHLRQKLSLRGENCCRPDEITTVTKNLEDWEWTIEPGASDNPQLIKLVNGLVANVQGTKLKYKDTPLSDRQSLLRTLPNIADGLMEDELVVQGQDFELTIICRESSNEPNLFSLWDCELAAKWAEEFASQRILFQDEVTSQKIQLFRDEEVRP